MASYGEGYGEEKRHGQTDEYGNPIKQHTTGGGLNGAGAHGGVGLPTSTHGESKLHRSGSSSSSSSSEDDGIGGRRKKGIKEKIKEKLPGGQKKEEQTYGTPGSGAGAYGTTGGYGSTATHEQTHEKKGIMDKIKEKLPGQH